MEGLPQQEGSWTEEFPLCHEFTSAAAGAILPGLP